MRLQHKAALVQSVMGAKGQPSTSNPREKEPSEEVLLSSFCMREAGKTRNAPFIRESILEKREEEGKVDG